MNRVFGRFLQGAMADAMDLADQSGGRLQVFPQPPFPSSRYAVALHLPFLRQLASGTVEMVTTEPVLVGLNFPKEYLMSADPHLLLSVVSVLTPRVFHPNVRGSFVCLGPFKPGASLRVLLVALYDVLGYRNVGLDERDVLEPDPCRFLRGNPDLLPRLMAPPLRGQCRQLSVTVTAR